MEGNGGVLRWLDEGHLWNMVYTTMETGGVDDRVRTAFLELYHTDEPDHITENVLRFQQLFQLVQLLFEHASNDVGAICRSLYVSGGKGQGLKQLRPLRIAGEGDEPIGAAVDRHLTKHGKGIQEACL